MNIRQNTKAGSRAGRAFRNAGRQKVPAPSTRSDAVLHEGAGVLGRWKTRASSGGFFGVALLVVAGCMPALSAASNPSEPSGKPFTFFVATNGNDAWSGARPDAMDTNGPFRSVEWALEATRQARKLHGTRSPSIVLRQGHYFLSEPLILTPEDSGLLITAYRQEVPVLSGGRLLKGWQKTTLGGLEVWTLDLAEAGQGQWLFRELWVDGRRATRARHPDKGYLPVAKLLDKSSDWTQGHSRFEFNPGDLRAWPSATNAEVMVMTRWVESRLPIASIDEGKHVASFSKRSVFELSAGDLYYVEGALELLDQPGEWHLDPARGRLYYCPLPGQDPAKITAVAPFLAQVVRFEGNPENGKFVDQVAFNGIEFSHTEWCFPSGFQKGKHAPEISPAPNAEVGGFAQAAIGVPGAVWGEGVRQALFAKCRFVNLGTYGLEFTKGCASNLIQGCEFAQLGAGGIKLGETRIRAESGLISRDNTVENCHFHDGGLMFHSAIGIWIGQSPGNRLIHNLVHDFYYTGISVGWTWGYDMAALATNTLVAYNHVHHIGVRSDGDGPILSDMAGIYTLGRHTGSVIHNNLWHDMAGIRYGGWGIYFDEGTTGIRAASNIVFRTTHGGFHQHYGATNSVVNNVFAFARDYQVQRSRVEDHVSFRFQTNIVYFNQGVLFGGNWGGDKFLVDRNVYWDLRSGTNTAQMQVGAAPWDKWRERGHDLNSLVADPLFIAPEKGDFRLRADSPAFKQGFQPIDIGAAGLAKP